MSFDQIFTIANIVFSVIIWIFVLVQRVAVEKIWNFFKKTPISENKWWKDVFLPAGPLGTGAILAALIETYPYPDVFAGSFWGRVFFGIFCGLVSGFVYRMLKKFVKNNESTDENVVSGSLSDFTEGK